MMFPGGASGSTAGGMKWVRIAIFAKSALAEIKRRIHPNAVIPVRFNGHTLREQTTSNIVAFMFFYIVIIVLLPAAAKWVATFVMLIGRLEIFTVLLLFSRALWKK